MLTPKQIAAFVFFVFAIVLLFLAGIGITDTPHLKIQPLGLTCLAIALAILAYP